MPGVIGVTAVTTVTVVAIMSFMAALSLVGLMVVSLMLAVVLMRRVRMLMFCARRVHRMIMGIVFHGVAHNRTSDVH